MSSVYMSHHLMFYFALVIFGYCVGNGFSEDEIDDVIASTQYGKIRGRKLYTNDGDPKSCLAFQNIPYAIPPLGQNRFRYPQPSIPWNGLRDGTKPGYPCLQRMDSVHSDETDLPLPKIDEWSEDCLNLNVYTPSLKGNYPVLMYIHGGGWQHGWATISDGRAYAIKHDVLMVTFHYRIGPFGFLSFDSSVLPGNYGLMDQLQAIKWVKQNIENFGGDPERITLAGDSTGAISVSLHTLSPLSGGLFNQVIYQSGSAITQNSVMFKELREIVSKDYLKALECEYTSAEQVALCLRAKPGNLIMAPPGLSPDSYSFIPVIDEHFVSLHPLVEAHLGKHVSNDTRYIAGVCSHEGYSMAKQAIPTLKQEVITREVYIKNVHSLVQQHFFLSSQAWDALTQAILEEYTEGGNTPDELLERLTEITGDMAVNIPTFYAAQAHSMRGAEGFFYEFAHRPSVSRKPPYVVTDHTEDTIFTWGASLVSESFGYRLNFTKPEIELDRMMLEYWSNFVKTGNPNGENVPKWPGFSKDLDYLTISTNPKAATSWKRDRIKFWSQRIPVIIATWTKKEEL